MNNFKSVFKWQNFCLFAAILGTIISQTPAILESKSGGFMYFIWLLPIIVIIYHHKVKISKGIFLPLFVWFLFFSYLFILDAFEFGDYFPQCHLYELSISVFVFYIGYLIAPHIKENDFKTILTYSLIISGLILSIEIYNNAFRDNFDLASRIYAYKEKNSASLILLSCIVFITFIYKTDSIKKLIFKILYIIFLSYMILIMKSRATIIGFFMIWWYLFFIQKNNRTRIRIFIIIAAIIAILFIYFNKEVFNFLYNAIILGGRDPSDLNDISSGRLLSYKEFPVLFNEKPFIGHGLYFIDNFPMSLLLQTGILGLVIILVLFVWVVMYMKRNYNFTNELHVAVSCLFLIYIVNGLFEEQSPLGPGARCFLFWLTFGYTCYINKKRKQYLDNKSLQI